MVRSCDTDSSTELCLDSPTLASVSPSGGPLSGLTVVSIFGSDFVETNETVVEFKTSPPSGNRYANATVLSSSYIKVITPSVPSASIYTVNVALNGQQFVSSGLTFQFYCTFVMLIVVNRVFPSFRVH